MENNYNNDNNNNNNDILSIDLFNRFFGLGRRGSFGTRDMFKSFYDMHKENITRCKIYQSKQTWKQQGLLTITEYWK